MPNANGKYSLEELLCKTDMDELRDLQKATKQWKNQKKDNNYRTLKDISLCLEKIVTLLEKQDTKNKELESKFRSVIPE